MGKATYHMSDAERRTSCGCDGFMRCIGKRVILVDERDGALFAGEVQVYTNFRGLAEPCRESLGLCNHAKLHCCGVCGRRFVARWATRRCSAECRKPVAAASLEKHRTKYKGLRERYPDRRAFVCAHCGQADDGRRSSRKYCSAACRQAAYRSRITPARA
jgi:hypothetical protein